MNSDDVRRQWTDRSGEYSPAYYAHYGPDETSEVIGQLLDAALDRRASVLELGFGAGRHLSYLQELGFDSLSGIELNENARDVLRDSYPELAEEGTFYFEAIEDVVPSFEDDQFDAVYSVETLQHLHPDADWVFEELHRVTSDRLITVENEGDGDHSEGLTVTQVNDEFPLYHRDWNRVLTDVGFVEIESRTLDRDTLRVFRPGSDADGSSQ